MQVNEKSRNEYHKRISSAMDYIQLNIQSDLNLESIAKAAHLSPFHFHKLFKLIVGETVADYSRRIKLEKAAGLFFYQKKLPITDVAMELGFSSSQNLAKSFKQHFNLTPTEIKNLSTKDELTRLIQKNRKTGNASAEGSTYTTAPTSNLMEAENMKPQVATPASEIETLKLNIAEFEQRHLIYKRLIGEYGVGVQEAFTELSQFVSTREITRLEPVYIIWDNPEITPVEKCRTDVCITLKEQIKETAPYNTQTIPAGKYAFIRTLLKQEGEYKQAWEQLFNEILNSGYQLNDAPCFKILHEEGSELEKGIFDISFCAAVKPL